VRGFKTLKTASTMIKGFEVRRAPRKGQAAIFDMTRDMNSKARLVERAFGIGPSTLAVAVQLLSAKVETSGA
jgi:transposase, IS6 family